MRVRVAIIHVLTFNVTGIWSAAQPRQQMYCVLHIVNALKPQPRCGSGRGRREHEAP
jgi:hypothetical protein